MDDSKTRDVLAYIILLGILILSILKISVPDRLWDIGFMAVSFFFAANRKPSLDKGETQQSITSTEVTK